MHKSDLLSIERKNSVEIVCLAIHAFSFEL